MKIIPEPIGWYDVVCATCETIITIAVVVCLASAMGCGGNAHANHSPDAGKLVDVPTIIILDTPPQVTPATDANRAASPPVVLRDIIAPPKAAVKIDANTYRACTCGDVCTCKDCPADCNLVARGDCPGGVCRVPTHSVVKQSLTTGSGDCSSCGSSGGIRGRARAAGGKAWKVLKGAGRFVLRR